MAASDTPWSNFTPSDYSQLQWKRACLIDTEQGAPDSKDRFKLPVREPSGVVNRNGVHAAAARIGQVDGVTSEQRAAAAQKLESLYRVELAETPPDSLTNIANESERSAPRDTERLWVTQWLKESPLETRAINGKGEKAIRTIGGYASVFEKRSHPLGGYVEIVERSCFNKSMATGWTGVIARFNHDDMSLLGTTRAQTLRLTQDNVGLDYSVDLPECRSDVYEYVQRGDISNSSFAFQVFDDEFTHDGDGYPVRHLLSARLVDVAPVTTPAYPDASVGLRSLAQQVGEAIEDVLSLSERNELRQLFIRTDNRGPAKPTKTKSGREALLELMKIRDESPEGEVA
jgi:uncharacterized protein